MKYIIITGDIHPIGGMQLLTSGKAEVLENLGWEVYVFFPTHESGKCVLPYLDKYNEGGFFELTLPPYKWTKTTREKVFARMRCIIGACKNDEQIIIESHSDRTSQWGEILASRVNAKHMLFLCNEIYRGKGKYYLENLDFYDFKHRRKELAGEMADILFKLFEGYKQIHEDEIYIFKYDENPVRDVINEKIDSIERYDWNICYIGRSQKGYFPNIIQGVADFSRNHSEKEIQLIFVGDISERRKKIHSVLGSIGNLKLTPLGDVAPIPKELFKKVDVVIAGSGSAKCAAYEGTYTIIADASNFFANGVLGYDTNDELYHSHGNQVAFDSALEKVLVDRAYDLKNNILPPYKGPKECTEQNFELIEKSCNFLEFYPEEKLCAPKTYYTDAICMRVYDWTYRNIPIVSKALKKIKKMVFE